MTLRRSIPAVLALSGTVFAAMAWLLNFLLLPGYYIWYRWICLALGADRRAGRWFWAASAAWNALVPLVILMPMGGWTLRAKTPLFLFALAHSAAAAMLSVCMALTERGSRSDRHRAAA